MTPWVSLLLLAQDVHLLWPQLFPMQAPFKARAPSDRLYDIPCCGFQGGSQQSFIGHRGPSPQGAHMPSVRPLEMPLVITAALEQLQSCMSFGSFSFMWTQSSHRIALGDAVSPGGTRYMGGNCALLLLPIPSACGKPACCSQHPRGVVREGASLHCRVLEAPRRRPGAPCRSRVN